LTIDKRKKKKASKIWEGIVSIDHYLRKPDGNKYILSLILSKPIDINQESLYF